MIGKVIKGLFGSVLLFTGAFLIITELLLIKNEPDCLDRTGIIILVLIAGLAVLLAVPGAILIHQIFKPREIKK